MLTCFETNQLLLQNGTIDKTIAADFAILRKMSSTSMDFKLSNPVIPNHYSGDHMRPSDSPPKKNIILTSFPKSCFRTQNRVAP